MTNAGLVYVAYETYMSTKFDGAMNSFIEFCNR